VNQTLSVVTDTWINRLHIASLAGDGDMVSALLSEGVCHWLNLFAIIAIAYVIYRVGIMYMYVH
jgi:hypothetical protein